MADDATVLVEGSSLGLPGEGSRVAGFTLGRKLGRGSQGVVYEARRLDDPRRYAAKVVAIGKESPAALSRLRRESTLTSRMDHPGIVVVHQLVEDARSMVIIMDQAVGRPADQLCDGRLGWELALHIIIRAARALDYAHRRNGLIHRDIKPANLIVDHLGPVLHGVKVIDFGLGRDRDSAAGDLTMTGEIMGTPLYISPEQAQGERTLTFATDIYALGASLFHLVAGRPVFMRNSPIEIMSDHCRTAPPTLSSLVPGCPARLADLVGYCLAKKPAERFRSYRTFLAMAEPLLVSTPFDAADAAVITPVDQPGGTTRSAWRRPGSNAAASVSTAWRRPGREPSPAPVDPTEPSAPRPTTRWMHPTIKAAPSASHPVQDAVEGPSTDTTNRAPQEVEQTIGPSADSRPAQPSVAPGTAIDEHFAVVRTLGAGAMGEVYEVEDRFINRRLAMKLMSATDMERPAAVARFKCEAAALAAVGHPAFPYLAGGGTFAGRDYIYMELVQGIDLRTWLQRSGNHLPERQALTLALQLAQAMEAAYRLSGMVHRDLKPANIMVAEGHDGSPQVRIVDFGVSVYIDYGEWDDYSSRTYTYVDDGNEGRVVGTPAYMSPEQILAQPPSPLMDMYAIGGILYQMLTGRTAFTAKGASALLMKVLNDPPPNLEDVPELTPATRQLVRRMLAKRPEARFKNYRQLVAAIGAALHGVRGQG